MAKSIIWIPEQKAAEMLLRKPRTLRKLVLSKGFPIAYTNINGRKYQYSESDIQQVLLQNSSIVN